MAECRVCGKHLALWEGHTISDSMNGETSRYCSKCYEKRELENEKLKYYNEVKEELIKEGIWIIINIFVKKYPNGFFPDDDFKKLLNLLDFKYKLKYEEDELKAILFSIQDYWMGEQNPNDKNKEESELEQLESFEKELLYNERFYLIQMKIDTWKREGYQVQDLQNEFKNIRKN